MSYPVPLNQAQADVLREGERQEALKREGRFAHTPKDTDVSLVLRLAMLVEEVGEVSREVLALADIVQEEPNSAKLYKELIQCSSIALGIAESIPSAYRG
jgi:NTP pyrophosphatase (non-canonical NTP hydrolase)